MSKREKGPAPHDPARLARAEALRQHCARYGTGRAAAAALGISPTHLSRLRRQLGLIEADRAEKRDRERRALSRPVHEAAIALGCTDQHVYRLRAKHARQNQTTPEETTSP